MDFLQELGVTKEAKTRWYHNLSLTSETKY